jgi:hypothetical protein
MPATAAEQLYRAIARCKARERHQFSFATPINQAI